MKPELAEATTAGCSTPAQGLDATTMRGRTMVIEACLANLSNTVKFQMYINTHTYIYIQYDIHNYKIYIYTVIVIL